MQSDSNLALVVYEELLQRFYTIVNRLHAKTQIYSRFFHSSITPGCQQATTGVKYTTFELAVGFQVYRTQKRTTYKRGDELEQERKETTERDM